MSSFTRTFLIILVYQNIQKLTLAKLDKYFETFNYCAVQPSDKTIYLKNIRSYDLACGIPGEVFCTWQCNKDPKCKHFNYKPVSLSCEMYYSDQTCFLGTTNCVFYQNKESWTNFSNVNVAVRQPAYQSSDWSSSNQAPLSNDGNPSGDWSQNTCSATTSDGENWWMVNLGQSYNIHHVVLTNRNDGWGHRENNFIVGVSTCYEACTITRGAYPLCGQYCGLASITEVMVVLCPRNTAGNSVIIQLPANGGDLLNFCELEVYTGV